MWMLERLAKRPFLDSSVLMLTSWFLNVDKYLLQFGQIHFTILTCEKPFFEVLFRWRALATTTAKQNKILQTSIVTSSSSSISFSSSWRSLKKLLWQCWLGVQPSPEINQTIPERGQCHHHQQEVGRKKKLVVLNFRTLLALLEFKTP